MALKKGLSTLLDSLYQIVVKTRGHIDYSEVEYD
jgi:hypothetical protein